METPPGNPEVLWQRRLDLLREFYHLGLQILADHEPLDTPRLSTKWKQLDRIWEAFVAMDADLREAPPPQDPQLRADLLKQAKTNAGLYSSLTEHCRQLQNVIKDLLPNLQTRHMYANTADDPPTAIQVKT